MIRSMTAPETPGTPADTSVDAYPTAKGDGIFLWPSGGQMVEMSPQAFDQESDLQRLIADHPGLLAGGQMASQPRRWILVRREAGVPYEEGAADKWFLDHLFIDQDAIPTFVEVKRASSTQLRRDVVAQGLDYVSSAALHWDAERLRSWFEATCQSREQDPDVVLSELLTVDEEEDTEPFWSRVETNLRAKRLRLVFLADRIPGELRRIVEFLNEQMAQTDVLAVEVRKYASPDGHQIFVPRVIGQTSTSEGTKGPRPKWNEETFVKALEKLGADIAEIGRRFIHWTQDHGLEPTWKETGSYIPTLLLPTGRFRLYALRKKGHIAVRGLQATPPFDRKETLDDLWRRFNQAGIPLSGGDIKKRLDLKSLVEPRAYDAFLKIAEWTFQVAREEAAKRSV